MQQKADPRLLVMDHEKNIGATQSFNLFFKDSPEPYASILEDDNWWEPDFLEKMVCTMKQFPTVQVAWANMRVWKEGEDGGWTDTGTTIWPWSGVEKPELFYWPHRRQIMSALHSNGAMMFRTREARNYATPPETPFILTEALRERSYPHPILQVPQPLAHFSLTRDSARSGDRATWIQAQVLLVGSFFKNVHPGDSTLQQVWQEARSGPAKSIVTLILAALSIRSCRYILKFATMGDWMYFVAFCFKRPLVCLRALRAVFLHKGSWEFLDRHTARRVEESGMRGRTL